MIGENIQAKKDVFIQILQTIYVLNFGVICLTALHTSRLRFEGQMQNEFMFKRPLSDTG